MDSITTNSLTFRWADEHLIVTTPKGQYHLNTSEASSTIGTTLARRGSRTSATKRGSEWIARLTRMKYVNG